jgi:hypothetical protein
VEILQIGSTDYKPSGPAHLNLSISRSLPLYLRLFLMKNLEARLGAFDNVWQATSLPRVSSPFGQVRTVVLFGVEALRICRWRADPKIR